MWGLEGYYTQASQSTPTASSHLDTSAALGTDEGSFFNELPQKRGVFPTWEQNSVYILMGVVRKIIDFISNVFEIVPFC